MALLSTKNRNTKLTNFFLYSSAIDFNLYFELNKIIVVFNETSKVLQFGGYFLIKKYIMQEKKMRNKDLILVMDLIITHLFSPPLPTWNCF